MKKKMVPKEIPIKKKKKTYQVHLFIALCLVILLYIKEVNKKMKELEACQNDDQGKNFLKQLDEILNKF